MKTNEESRKGQRRGIKKPTKKKKEVAGRGTLGDLSKHHTVGGKGKE